MVLINIFPFHLDLQYYIQKRIIASNLSKDYPNMKISSSGSNSFMTIHGQGFSINLSMMESIIVFLFCINRFILLNIIFLKITLLSMFIPILQFKSFRLRTCHLPCTLLSVKSKFLRSADRFGATANGDNKVFINFEEKIQEQNFVFFVFLYQFLFFC